MKILKMIAYIIISVVVLLIAIQVFTSPLQEEIRPDSLDLYIDRLAHNYECKDCDLSYYRKLDSNSQYSYSCLQFQQETFFREVDRYLPSIQINKDVMIYDCAFQKALARQMFLHDTNAWKHWQTSVKRGLGLPPTINHTGI